MGDTKQNHTVIHTRLKHIDTHTHKATATINAVKATFKYVKYLICHMQILLTHLN